MWGSLWARAILLTSAAAGIAIGIELHLARQIWLWLRTGYVGGVKCSTVSSANFGYFDDIGSIHQPALAHWLQS